MFFTLSAFCISAIGWAQSFNATYSQQSEIELPAGLINSIWECRLRGNEITINHPNYNFANDYIHLQMFDSITYTLDSWKYREGNIWIDGEGAPLDIIIKGWHRKGDIRMRQEAGIGSLNGYYNGIELRTWNHPATTIKNMKIKLVKYADAIQGHNAADKVDTYVLTGNTLMLPCKMKSDLRNLIKNTTDIRLDIRRMHDPKNFCLAELIDYFDTTRRTIRIVGGPIYNGYVGSFIKLIYEDDYETAIQEPEQEPTEEPTPEEPAEDPEPEDPAVDPEPQPEEPVNPGNGGGSSNDEPAVEPEPEPQPEEPGEQPEQPEPEQPEVEEPEVEPEPEQPEVEPEPELPFMYDGADFFFVEEGFYADSITYTRVLSYNADTTKNMSTMILPFDIEAEYLTELDATPYTISGITSTTTRTKKLTGTIPANTPFIVKRVTNPKNTILTITVKDVYVPATPSQLQSGYLVGVYQKQFVPVGCKVIQSATFTHVETEDIVITPFRAFVTMTPDEYYNNAPALHMSETGIEEIEEEISNEDLYNLLGAKTTAPVRGQIYMRNGKKYMIR